MAPSMPRSLPGALMECAAWRCWQCKSTAWVEFRSVFIATVGLEYTYRDRGTVQPAAGFAFRMRMVMVMVVL